MKWLAGAWIFILASVLTASGQSAPRPHLALVPQVGEQNSAQPEKPSVDMMESAYLLSCLSALARGDTAKAEQACGEAIALNSQDVDAYKLRGYAYLIDHRFERAGADFRIALKLSPNDSANLAGYGQSLSGLGRFALAVPQFEKAVALAPSNAAFLNALCWARAGTGKRLQEALDDCNRALALSPDAPGILNSRGLVHFRMGQFDAAIQDYSASLAGKPTQPSARFGRGLVELSLHQIEQGRTDIIEARRGDADIDDLFVLLGILPQQCGLVGNARPSCPPGFPPRPPSAPSQPYMAVSSRNDPARDDILAIEVGRLEVMVNQIAILTHQSSVFLTGTEDAPSQKIMFDRLAASVARFNTLLPSACTHAHIPMASCHSYRPEWRAGVSADLGDAVDDAYAHVGPVWQTLCLGHKKECIIE